MPLTVERTREALSYDAETGVFTWRIDRPRARAGSVAGSTDKDGYWVVQLDGRKYKAHRLAWFYVFGEWPPSKLDHIDRVRLNFRIGNLRCVTDRGNAENRTAHRNTTSSYVGVSFHKASGRWQAQITAGNRVHYLGLFDSEEAASAAYVASKPQYHSLF